MKNESIVYQIRCINYLLIAYLKTDMIDEMDKTLGELIQEALKDLGWSNAELARRSHFSPTYIGNLIRDYSPGTKTGKFIRLPSETVDRIADTLKQPRTLFRKAAGLLPESDITSRPSTIAEALDSFLDDKGLSLEEREKIRPLLEVVEREIERLTANHPSIPKPFKGPVQIIRDVDLKDEDEAEEISKN